MHTYGTVKAQATALAEALLEDVAGTPEALIAAREDVMAAIKELRVLADELEERALARWPSEGFHWQVVVEGLGSFHRGYKNNRTTWDDRRCALAVTKAALDAGRVHHPNDVVDALLTPASVAYWRLEPLRRSGVDPDDFRTVIKGRPCVALSV